MQTFESWPRWRELWIKLWHSPRLPDATYLPLWKQKPSSNTSWMLHRLLNICSYLQVPTETRVKACWIVPRNLLLWLSEQHRIWISHLAHACSCVILRAPLQWASKILFHFLGSNGQFLRSRRNSWSFGNKFKLVCTFHYWDCSGMQCLRASAFLPGKELGKEKNKRGNLRERGRAMALRSCQHLRVLKIGPPVLFPLSLKKQMNTMCLRAARTSKAFSLDSQHQADSIE